MKIIYIFILSIIIFGFTESSFTENTVKYNKLTKEEEKVIIYKGTEIPFSGKYVNSNENGVYTCKRCDAVLYKSDDKFDSHCGWPSFDDEVEGAIKKIPDADGIRTEIVCSNCGAHLGHIFYGEHLTEKNARHCVNSISLNFIPAENKNIETAYFAGGCFWGVEYQIKKIDGVIKTQVGYMGGDKDNPTYENVCYENTGHAETVEVQFDNKKTDFETIAKLFFEIHDPTEIDRQGPDIGKQYRSEIFYTNDKQKEISIKLINILESKGYKIATKLIKAENFWVAEDYHQNYYNKRGGNPYCHIYKKRF